MTSLSSSFSQRFLHGRKTSKVSKIVMLSLSLITLTLLNGCTGLQPLPEDNKFAARGSWLLLQDIKQAEISPGVNVKLPDAPYRARFADDNGIYYQASQQVIYKTSHGITVGVEGGLFVRYDQPTVAVVWYEPVLGSATMPHPQTFKVQRFTPASNN
jgi:hypothetical protein